MNTTTRVLVIVSTLIAAAPATANQTTVSAKGSSELFMVQNACPQKERHDCDPGAVCHMPIRLKGQPALKLLQALKQTVQKEGTFKEWGLTIYESKDGLLRCDETKKMTLFCDIWFNTREAKIEPGAICE